MALERTKEMKEALSEPISMLLEKRLAQIMLNYEAKKDDFSTLMGELRKLAGSREGCFAISYLRTSFLTGSHNFKMDFYTGELYVEENPDGFLYSISRLLQGLEEDITGLTIILKKQFIRVFTSETEEIRRYYMELVYAACEKLFCHILSDAGNVTDRDVYYGEYMGSAVRIGKL